MLERTLADAGVPVEEQMNLIRDLERKETEYMRLKRHKISVDDFELLTIIGRGAFGEVQALYISLISSNIINSCLLSLQFFYIFFIDLELSLQ